MEPKFFTLRKKFYDAVRNFIDKKIKTTWTCCNSNMAMLGGYRGSCFDPGGQKGASIYLNNTTRGEIF
jgi:hypothetical protein